MPRHQDRTDSYYLFVFAQILKLAPLTGLCAGVTFTIARVLGKFAFVSIPSLIGFDIACLSYILVAYIFKCIGVQKNGRVDQSRILLINYILAAIIIFQWNLITYIFPTRSFWGFAPMFVLLAAFLFQSKPVLFEILGLSVSIAISWIIKGEELLPATDELFEENFTLRIVALLISFSVIYILTCYAEKFTKLVKDNFQFMEEQNLELETMGRDIIDFTADIIEERDATSGSHVKRLKAYTAILAEQVADDYPEYGLTDEKIQQITLACVLHDVGKIAIPDTILKKPGKLTTEEFEVIKTHTTLGARIIDKLPDSVGESYKKYCREICQFHHEKWDGKGYPVGLKGDEIPISAQIVSVVDCYDALTNERPYKKALPGEMAIYMILNGECGVFSEKIKKCLVACKEKFLNIG